MKVGLWRVTKNVVAFARAEWLLFRLFGIKRKYPCGRDKKTSYLCCGLNPNEENSVVINDGKTHELCTRTYPGIGKPNYIVVADVFIDDKALVKASSEYRKKNRGQPICG